MAVDRLDYRCEDFRWQTSDKIPNEKAFQIILYYHTKVINLLTISGVCEKEIHNQVNPKQDIYHPFNNFPPQSSFHPVRNVGFNEGVAKWKYSCYVDQHQADNQIPADAPPVVGVHNEPLRFVFFGRGPAVFRCTPTARFGKSIVFFFIIYNDNLLLCRRCLEFKRLPPDNIRLSLARCLHGRCRSTNSVRWLIVTRAIACNATCTIAREDAEPHYLLA
mmetsp:Transcript_60763/g.107971  ORF Transcript_60763/g.107971 Transcript_60763/m.107971 type:complete len:219 (-) Transcript_60763:3-659(-)